MDTGNRPSKSQIITEWYEEYCSIFTLCSAFGWNFKEKSQELLIATESNQEKLGVSTSELRNWISQQPRDTINGTIPVPDFSDIA